MRLLWSRSPLEEDAERTLLLQKPLQHTVDGYELRTLLLRLQRI